MEINNSRNKTKLQLIRIMVLTIRKIMRLTKIMTRKIINIKVYDNNQY